MSADIKLVRWPDRDRDDFERLTDALSRVRAAVSKGSDLISPPPQGPEEPSDLDRARALLAQDHAREAAAAAADLFVNPAWRIMLMLFIADGEERTLSAQELKDGCGVLPPPAARWLAMLERRGLVMPMQDAPGDAIRLTDDGRTLIAQCLHAL